MIYHLRQYWQGIILNDSIRVRQSSLASENLTITWKWYKIGGKLVLITNRKAYMSFRLVLKAVTLNGAMAHILRYFTEFGSFRGARHCIKVVEDIPKHCATEM